MTNFLDKNDNHCNLQEQRNLQVVIDKLDTINTQLDILCKGHKERVDKNSKVLSDRLRSVALNQKCSFSPQFSSEPQAFLKFWRNWATFSKQVADSQLCFLYLKSSVQEHPTAKHLVESASNYQEALSELYATFGRVDQLSTILIQKIYDLPPQSQTVTEEAKLLHNWQIIVFQIKNHGLEKNPE